MLKLIAFDPEDLAVVSAHTQDAVLKIADLAYQPAHRRFVALVNRFDWTKAVAGSEGSFERRQSAVRIERVLRARLAGIDLASKGQVLNLLAIGFEPAGPDDPAGAVTFYFAGDGAIRLDVECIEVELQDLGPTWSTDNLPTHPDLPSDPPANR